MGKTVWGYEVTQTDRSSWETRLRVRLVWVAAIVWVAIIVARAAYLQIWESGQQGLLSQANHIELVREEAERGIIKDRRGVPLVTNEWNEEFGRYQRKYPYGSAVAMVVGYMSEVTESELGCRLGICYPLGSYIGRVGVEREMETVLKGKDGGVLSEVDAGGKIVRELGSNEPDRGQDVTLSIEVGLQEKMYQAMKGKTGAAVAIDMRGKVLGLVSLPTYDPKSLEKYLSDTSKEYFLNRAVSAQYPPGSIFKLVTAYAGLATGKITPETKIEDTGEIRINDYRYGNWYFDQYGRKEGELDLERALARSNDVYFYKVGEMVGVDELTDWAHKFGLGEETGIQLTGEIAGLVPSRLQKERSTGEKWFLGNTYHLAIGQGDLLVTPLQAARMTAAAVSGRVCRVSLLKEGVTECRDLGIATDQIESVREGMRQVCAPTGTAFPLFDFAPYVLCKTGTAQHAGQKSESDLPHAWITVAYPGENPEMVLTVLVEAGGEGSAVAAPIAKEILEYWRDLNK